MSKELKVFKTIKRGVLKTPTAYRKAITAAGNRINASASQILDKVPVSKTEVEVDLAVVTSTDLGFKKAAPRIQIYRRIIEIGAELCQAEDGLTLRLAYQNQIANEWLRMAMEPIGVSNGSLSLFGVICVGNEQWLFSFCGHPNALWFLDDCWVVVVPRR